jgi:tripartite-type tricarboxylate transporter receptor subunit TctC
MKTLNCIKAVGWMILSGLIAWPSLAHAKDMTVWIGFSPGGGSDNTVRPIAQYLGRYMPGNPNVVVNYMPGATSRKLAGYIHDIAPKDGSEIGFVQRIVYNEALLRNEKELFDPRKLVYLGSLSTERTVCLAWHDSPFKSIDDARKKVLQIGSTGNDRLIVNLVNKVAATKLKLVIGYSGGSEIDLALERREVDGRCQSWISFKSSRADWYRDKKVNVLLQVSLSKNPDLPDVPSILDIASDADKDSVRLAFSEQEMGTPFIAPPGMPPEIQATLRTALAKTMADPDFLAEAKRRNLTVEPVAGETIQNLLEAAHGAPKAVLERARWLVAD